MDPSLAVEIGREHTSMSVKGSPSPDTGPAIQDLCHACRLRDIKRC
jgi:hypothetical protein